MRDRGLVQQDRRGAEPRRRPARRRPGRDVSRSSTGAAPTRRGSPSTGRRPRASCVVRVDLDRPDHDDAAAAVVDAANDLTTVKEWSRRGRGVRLLVASDGDGKLADWIEERVPGARVFSIGTAMEIVKDFGSAGDVDAAHDLRTFRGTHGIGHTRMATESRVDIAHSHPFWARPFPDISVVHNGQITNYHRLRRRLEQRGHRFATENDSEVIAVYIADKPAGRETPRRRAARHHRTTWTARSRT